MMSLLFIFEGRAQEPLYSQLSNSQIYANPAFAGNTNYARISSGYRNHLPGLNNAFVSYYASYDQFAPSIGGGLGATVSRDVQANGVFSATALSLAYSYTIHLRSSLAIFGLQAGIFQQAQNLSSITLPEQNPYSSQQIVENLVNESSITPDFSFGSSFVLASRYQLNMSFKHINFINRKSASIITSTNPFSFQVQLLANMSSHENNRPVTRLFLYPGFTASFQKTHRAIDIGANFGYSSVKAGLWLRNTSGLNLNALIGMLGYEFSGLFIGYSYDFWPMQFVQAGFYSSHELAFVYLFDYNNPKKRMRAVNCPKFY